MMGADHFFMERDLDRRSLSLYNKYVSTHVKFENCVIPLK